MHYECAIEELWKQTQQTVLDVFNKVLDVTKEAYLQAAMAAFPLGRAGELVTVGRWMSKGEFALMSDSGRVVESNLLGVTSVAFPASPTAYAGAAAGSVYAEFKISVDSLRSIGSDGWAKIYGPSSMFAQKLGITEMPKAIEPVIKATKP